MQCAVKIVYRPVRSLLLCTRRQPSACVRAVRFPVTRSGVERDIFRHGFVGIETQTAASRVPRDRLDKRQPVAPQALSLANGCHRPIIEQQHRRLVDQHPQARICGGSPSLRNAITVISLLDNALASGSAAVPRLKKAHPMRCTTALPANT